ncbi:LysR substrate-binding domain-containing protein [Marinomonas sp. PE14-40]|uniref:LysR substrate-binding domain-containing protein n=1 Tax=Marinomonas sp. PE14-40 TaxID=3060621 RepID=UPI003F669A62
MILSRISLASLRTFACVAYHGSHSLAAEQLCISPSAVSHQMKLLEQQLEVSLFIRRSRGVELTHAGQELAEYASQAMHQLEQGLQSAVNTSKQTLSIAAIPAVVQQWLVPRLNRFYKKHPDIELSLLDQDALVDFNQQAIDLHIHFGSGEFIGLRSEFLMAEWATPVCSPMLIEQSPDLLMNVQDLLISPKTRRLTYLGFNEDKPGGLTWTGWFNQAGLTLNTQQASTSFNHLAPLFNAAIAGQGIALGWQQLIDNEIRSKQLVALSEIRVPLKYSYYAVAPDHHFKRPIVQSFIDWIKSEASN